MAAKFRLAGYFHAGAISRVQTAFRVALCIPGRQGKTRDSVSFFSWFKVAARWVPERRRFRVCWGVLMVASTEAL